MIGRFVSVVSLILATVICCRGSAKDLGDLKPDQTIRTLRVANLYADSNGQIVGAKFREIRSGAPIYIFGIETVPQVFMWIDTPAESNEGLAHSLEHLLGGKGTKGRYVNLLKEMRLAEMQRRRLMISTFTAFPREPAWMAFLSSSTHGLMPSTNLISLILRPSGSFITMESRSILQPGKRCWWNRVQFTTKCSQDKALIPIILN